MRLTNTELREAVAQRLGLDTSGPLPAFESDLGALQTAGVIDAVANYADYGFATHLTLELGGCGEGSCEIRSHKLNTDWGVDMGFAEAMAKAFARVFLQLPVSDTALSGQQENRIVSTVR